MGSTQTESLHLRFSDAGTSPSGLTRRWELTTLDGSPLGRISWYSPWRKYCFSPFPESIFDDSCLREIAEFCAVMTRVHKEK